MKRFSKTWACVLMPNHIHLVIESTKPCEARWDLATEMRAAGRKFFPGHRLWMPAAEPELVSGKLHLQRMIRYVHLNPCRSAIVPDPIEWEWSTHRDALGLTTTPWIDMQRLALLFGNPRGDFPARFHSYISSDPSVSVTGTPPLRRVQSGTVIAATPRICMQAVAAVSRARSQGVLLRGALRDGAIQLAKNIARNPISVIQREFDVDERTVRRVLSRPGDQALEAALRSMLADPRCAPIQTR